MNIALSVKAFSVILFFSLSHNLYAAQHYVIDDLNAFIHSGPGTNYRIIGAVKAGKAVKLVSSKEKKGHLNIELKNKTGWINAKLLSTQPGLAAQLEKTQKILVKAQADAKALNKNTLAKNKALKTEIKAKSNEIAQLKIDNTESVKQLSKSKEQVLSLQHKLDNLDDSKKMQWLSYGGAWALIWFIVGIVIPRIQWKKKQENRWM